MAKDDKKDERRDDKKKRGLDQGARKQKPKATRYGFVLQVPLEVKATSEDEAALLALQWVIDDLLESKKRPDKVSVFPPRLLPAEESESLAPGQAEGLPTLSHEEARREVEIEAGGAKDSRA